MKLAMYKGRTRLFDRLVQWWTRAGYSHCELVFQTDPLGRSECASSSWMDSGVRVTWITLDPARWDVVDLPTADDQAARAWVHAHMSQGYDLLGLLGFVWPRRDDATRWFCSEACAAALGLPDPWRYSPGTLAALVPLLARLVPPVIPNDEFQ